VYWGPTSLLPGFGCVGVSIDPHITLLAPFPPLNYFLRDTGFGTFFMV